METRNETTRAKKGDTRINHCLLLTEEKDMSDAKKVSPKRLLFALIPNTDSVRSASIVLMLLQCYRVFKNFACYTADVKKYMKQKYEKGVAKLKAAVTIDTLDVLKVLRSKMSDEDLLSRTPKDLAKRNTIVADHLATLKLKTKSMIRLQNMRNHDHKAVSMKSLVQQVAANAVSQLDPEVTCRNADGLYFLTSQESIDTLEANCAEHFDTKGKTPTREAMTKLLKTLT